MDILNFINRINISINKMIKYHVFLSLQLFIEFYVEDKKDTNIKIFIIISPRW